MSHDIFISYARSREADALRVADTLTELGYEVWRDDQLAAHQTFGDVIQERLDAAKAVVVLWSQEAVKSQWVRSEANRARSLDKLVQVNLDGVALPMPFDQIHCASLKGWRGEPDAPGWRQALASLAELVEEKGPSGAARHSASHVPPASAGDTPSLAVLPFANLSGDPEQEYFIDGLAEEIVTALTRIRNLSVIAASSSLALKGRAITPVEAAATLGVRYILEGSVRRAGERVRISAKLIDAYQGTQIWADRFDDKLDDIFELQDKVAISVAGRAEFSVQTSETVLIMNRPTADLRSYDLVLRALVELRTYKQEAMFKALDMLERAIEMDPNYAWALSLAASAHAIIMQFHWTDDPASHGRKAAELVERSVRTGANDAQVLATAAMAYWTFDDPATAAPLAERALALNPGSSWSQLACGQIHATLGEIEVAEACIVRSMQLDPLSPNRNLQLSALASIRLVQHRFAEAVDICHELLTIANHPNTLGLLAAALGHQGDAPAAGEALAHLRELSPMAPREIAAQLFHRPEHRELFLSGVSQAEAMQTPPLEAKPA